MLPLETKQPGGKLLSHSDLRGGVFLEEVSCSRIGQVAGTFGYGEELSSSINAGNFLTSCKVYCLASQEGLCSME
jgi:energy-converting hydrogenase Eha subunit B